MVSKHENEELCQIIPDYTHDFASCPTVEAQLSGLILWLFLIIPLIIPNYSFNYVLNCPDGVQARKSNHSLLFPWLFPWLFPIIPNYSSHGDNRRRSHGHSLGNQRLQKRAIACRGPEVRCPLLFHRGQQIPDRRWKESAVLLSMLVRPAIRNN